MKRILFISVFSMAAIVMTSCDKDDDNNNNNNNSNTPNATDNNFMTQAAYANRSVVDLGQLALSKSTNDSVKMFAQMVVNDHTAAITSLDSLAAKYSYTLPTTADSAHIIIKDSLNVYTGHTFDTAYINGQVRDHNNLIAVYQDDISNGSADSIKAYANTLLPTIQAHKQLADTISLNLQ
jgi:putative membrane protein